MEDTCRQLETPRPLPSLPLPPDRLMRGVTFPFRVHLTLTWRYWRWKWRWRRWWKWRKWELFSVLTTRTWRWISFRTGLHAAVFNVLKNWAWTCWLRGWNGDARVDTLRGVCMYSSTPCGAETVRGQGMDPPWTPAAGIDGLGCHTPSHETTFNVNSFQTKYCTLV